MISVHAIRGGGGRADYYLQAGSGCEHELERGIDPGYYTDTPDPVGRWVGDGAAALGLTGELTEDGQAVFRELLNGRLDREQISTPVMRGQGELRRDIRIGAYDLTISAPKSVSTLMALGSPEVVQTIIRAHANASGQALDLLQQLSARAARGHHGDGQRATRIPTDGFVAAAFQHTTSRAHDPQLHTHVVAMNLIRGEDGRWSSVDSRTLHRQATTASYLYQHLLRAELTKELGVAWEPVKRGVAEISDVPANVRKEFSTRSRQIKDALGETDDERTLTGKARTAAAKAACLVTRPEKTHVDHETLRQSWIRRAIEKGFGPQELDALLEQRHGPDAIDRDEISRLVLSGAGATRERATFDQGTVLRELISALPPGSALTREDLLSWTSELINDDQVIQVMGEEFRTFTTADMLATEQKVTDFATRQTLLPLAQVENRTAITALARSGLRADQVALARALVTSGRAVDVVSGPAGSGKTSGLRVAKEIWNRHGMEVRGTAVAALTAQGLQQATGAESVSVTRLLNKPEVHLPANGVLLVDEAGMIGTRQLLRLLQVAEQRNCKVVTVGDPAQLPELEAGGSFAALTQLPTALHLEGHGRQINGWEQKALFDLRQGHVTAALDAYDQHDRLHLASSPSELHSLVVQDYTRVRSELGNPWDVVVLSSSRREVGELNHAIRTQLLQQGRLGARALRTDTPHGERDFRKGDQVLVTRNHHDKALLNGTHATVQAVRRDGLMVKLTDGRRILLDKDWLTGGDLEHGYAMTLHKAQGRTVHTSLVLSDESLSQEGGYVGLSRGTHANHLYLDTGSEAALRDCGDIQRPTNTWRPEPERPTRALTRKARQGLATDALPHARTREAGLER